SATLSLVGGKDPYTCTRVSGELPSGLALTNLQIRGFPEALGSGTFTASCTDTFGFRVTRDITIAVTLEALPTITINGLPDSIRPGEQTQFTVDASSAYPVEIRGTLSLGFVANPAVPGIDSMIRLINGGTTAAFSIGANATRAAFVTGQNIMAFTALQTGT